MVVADFRADLAMQIAVFSARPYDRRFLEEANLREGAGQPFQFVYFDAALDVHTAALAQDCAAVCVFVNDRLDAPVLQVVLSSGGAELPVFPGVELSVVGKEKGVMTEEVIALPTLSMDMLPRVQRKPQSCLCLSIYIFLHALQR